MNYNGKKVAITGVTGFIGSALYKALEETGAYVNVLIGDITDPKTFDGPTGVDYEYDYLFHFAAPSSQIQFARNPKYCIETTIKGFINALDVCNKYGIKLIYPSTGLLSQDKFNEYAMCKKLCEDMAKGTDALGLRIFATYGPGESHKRDYASVPYLFARDMVNGNAPLVFGDGSQSRDFLYITDVVAAIMVLAEEYNDPVIDIGSGKATTFKEIISEIVLLTGHDGNFWSSKNSPQNYINKTLADTTELHKYYIPKVTFAEGIKAVVDSLK